MGRAWRRGALAGLAAGILALTAVLAVAVQCLPFRIARPPEPWPWACSDPVYAAIGFLAFPVNLLTDDLARAVLLAPLSAAVYAALGAIAALVVGRHHG